MSTICPDCGSPSTIAGAWHSTLLSGTEWCASTNPGDRSPYACTDCGAAFIAVIPEPRDPYLGDGVFARNH